MAEDVEERSSSYLTVQLIYGKRTVSISAGRLPMIIIQELFFGAAARTSKDRHYQPIKRVLQQEEKKTEYAELSATSAFFWVHQTNGELGCSRTVLYTDTSHH